MNTSWHTRAENPSDIPAIRRVVLAAFETSMEADLVDALRADESWIPGLSIVAVADDDIVAGYALITRCHIGDAPALALAPVAVSPEYQRTGAGQAATRAALQAAADMGERHVVVLGHPEYYPRFGFERASAHGIRVGFEVPDEALMAMTLDGAYPLPSGTVRYAAPFGV